MFEPGLFAQRHGVVFVVSRLFTVSLALNVIGMGKKTSGQGNKMLAKRSLHCSSIPSRRLAMFQKLDTDAST